MRALLFAAAAALPAPALAQHEGHADHAAPAAVPDQEHAEADRAEDHSAHAPATDAPTEPSDAHAGHGAGAEANPPPGPADEHAGHAAPDIPASDEHSGHTLTGDVAPPVAGPPAEAFGGPENAADAIFGDTAMALARREMARMHGDVPAYRVLIDRLEARIGDGVDHYLFDAQAWYGGDIDKLWLKAEGDGAFGGAFEGAELQALWSHAVSPWFDLQAGVRYDIGPGEDRGHLVLGVQGLAPYWIELEATAFLSDRGDFTARVEAEHDVRVTRRLILQPRAELDFALQDIPAERTGAGLTMGSLGLRLRYQVTPLLGPYLGVEYERAFGKTRQWQAAAGEDTGGVRLLAGIRAWF